MKKLNFLLIALFFATTISAQSTKIWLTVDDTRQIQKIQTQFGLSNIKKALPDSKLKELQKVYEVELSGDYSNFIKYVNETKELSNPEVIEEFTLLYEPNDYLSAFTEDYALDLIQAKDAWNITKGSPVIKIGITDSNFDTLHEELAGAYSYISSNINNSNYNHGTAVAITAAGNTDNNAGKSSIGNKCKMMLYAMSYNHLLQATYAGARVINLSWASGCSYNSYYQSVIDEVYNNGTVLIAAAGNGPTCGGADNYVYPASFQNVISVSSIGPNDNHQRYPGNASSTHQHNDSVDLVAPGYDVALSISNNVYTTGNGTSFAAPYVSGTVGLMLSVNPCLSPAEVEMILKSTAVSVDSLNPLYLGELGAGRLNAKAAVQMAKDLIPIDFSVVTNEASCTYGVPSIAIQLNQGNINDYNLQWSDGSNQWVRTDLNSGTHNFTISSPTGCSINQDVTFQTTGPFFDYSNSIFVEDENFVLVDSNNDGVINIRGTIVIGSDYEINGKNLNFTDNSDLSSNYPNSGIVVKNGANLTVKGSQLNSVNECSNNWGGIELWSSSNNIASVSVENSTIENAKMAVSNISKYANKNELEEIGGQIKIKNSTINNSKVGVNIIETIGQSNVHELMNNSFSNASSISSPVYVNLNGVKNVSIKDNSFVGSSSVVKTMKGTAIKAKNSIINSIVLKPSVQDNSFDNIYNELYVGIDFQNTTKDALDLKVYNELFNNVEKCLLISGAYNGEIAFNEFNITSGSNNDASFGIKTFGENNLIIKENFFYSETSVNNYGMISESNATGEGLIKLNTFEGYFVNGINFIGANSFNEVSCNDFNITGQYDWFIYKNDSGELGSLDVKEELNINIFSDSSNVVLNLKNHNDNQNFIYRDAFSFLPYEVSESITIEEMQIEIKREEFCYNADINISVIDESALSTEELDQEETFSFYPNPSTGIFKIASKDNANIEEVHIMTTEGKVIETIHWNQQESVDMTSYSAGTYLVGLQLGSSVKTERVVIL